ncbi:MAG: hypothetical protein IK990_05705 [Ruminiclostridium sp.]|nr:hypothetical protein [Ruminiclostridium sp.]
MKNVKIDVTTLSANERAVIEARRQYQKEWRAANKDKVREHNRRFWEKRAAQSAATRTDNETATNSGT